MAKDCWDIPSIFFTVNNTAALVGGHSQTQSKKAFLTLFWRVFGRAPSGEIKCQSCSETTLPKNIHAAFEEAQRQSDGENSWKLKLTKQKSASPPHRESSSQSQLAAWQRRRGYEWPLYLHQNISSQTCIVRCKACSITAHLHPDKK